MKTGLESCPLCDSMHSVVLSRYARDRSPLTTLLCTNCGLGRSERLPPRDEALVYYRDEYRLEYKRAHQPKGGTAGPGPVSVLNPWAPPRGLSSSQ